MQAFRIVKERRALEAFTGEGARLYPGRWNHAGVPMVYAAESRALAALEALVHFGGDEAGIAFVLFRIEIPDETVRTLDPNDLPSDWRSASPAPGTRDLGSAWHSDGKSVALRVPSVLIPEEHCVLLNPGHADVRRVTIGFPTPFSFDPRMV